MPECPRCKEQISTLDQHSKEYWSRVLLANGDVKNEECLDVDDVYFACPACSADLTHEWETAVKFLRGEGLA